MRYVRHHGTRAALLIAWSALVGWADDRVTLNLADGRGATSQVTGTIIDYTGKQLEIDIADQVRRKFPAEQVAAVETKYTADHVAADGLYAKQHYPAATAKYQNALKADERRWVRRKILAQLVRCYRAQNGFAAAGEYFLLLVKDDPDALDFDAIPLAWLPGESAGVETKAAEWLAKDDQPVAVLIGASHLLQSPQAANALPRLQRLVDHRDPRIATLANFQLLRALVATTDDATLQRFGEAIERAPAKLRAGPYYTLGRAWIQRNQPTTAALYLLRNPILYPQDHRLASESLLLAAESLNKAEQKPEAQRLARELATSYPQSRAGREVRSRAMEWELEVR
jgi:hypothetical protein